MEEIKIKQKDELEVPVNKEPSLADKVELMWNEENNVLKRKPLKLMRKAKASKRKTKNGWVGVITVDENNIASGERVLLKDSAFKSKDGLFHATDSSEMLMWEGKFPVFIQESKKINPIKIQFNKNKNETYGQKYIMAKMLAEAIKPKTGGMGIILWFLGIGAVIFLINKFFFTGGA